MNTGQSSSGETFNSMVYSSRALGKFNNLKKKLISEKVKHFNPHITGDSVKAAVYNTSLRYNQGAEFKKALFKRAANWEVNSISMARIRKHEEIHQRKKAACMKRQKAARVKRVWKQKQFKTSAKERLKAEAAEALYVTSTAAAKDNAKRVLKNVTNRKK